MVSLLKKSRVFYFILLGLYVTGFGAGFIAGKTQNVSIEKIQNSALFRLNSSLEYKVPVYGDLLEKYKEKHRKKTFELVRERNRAGLSRHIFFNNFFAANLTMCIRSLTIAPLVLYPYGRYLQGMIFAQNPDNRRIWKVFLFEFGSYLLVIGASLALLFWTLIPNKFGFTSRKAAFFSGMKLLIVMWLISGIFLFIGSLLEAGYILNMFPS